MEPPMRNGDTFIHLVLYILRQVQLPPNVKRPQEHAYKRIYLKMVLWHMQIHWEVSGTNISFRDQMQRRRVWASIALPSISTKSLSTSSRIKILASVVRRLGAVPPSYVTLELPASENVTASMDLTTDERGSRSKMDSPKKGEMLMSGWLKEEVRVHFFT